MAGDAIKSVTDAIRNWCRQNTLITSRASLTLVCKTRLLLLENTTIRESWLRRVQQSLTLQLGTGLHKIYVLLARHNACLVDIADVAT
jgi:hypothetical protein